MTHSFTHLLYHLVFATKERRGCLDSDIRPRLFAFLAQRLREDRGIPLAINGMPEHAHVLVQLRPDKALSDVVRGLKADSSRWLKTTFPELGGFAWQTGYAAFTVSISQADRVRVYIENQEEHHRDRTYLDEFRTLLKAHGFDVSLEELEGLDDQEIVLASEGDS
jgi:REP element-mobilizing transposase RayT